MYRFIRAAGWRPVFACSVLSGWPAHGTLLQKIYIRTASWRQSKGYSGTPQSAIPSLLLVTSCANTYDGLQKQQQNLNPPISNTHIHLYQSQLKLWDLSVLPIWICDGPRTSSGFHLTRPQRTSFFFQRVSILILGFIKMVFLGTFPDISDIEG